MGIAKRGGACASLGERGRLRRPERGDYLSFAAHQREPVAAASRVQRPPPHRGAFSLSRAYARTHACTHVRMIHGSSVRPLLSSSHRRFTLDTLRADRAFVASKHARTHSRDFSTCRGASSPLAREAWKKRVITRICARNISLQCKRARAGSQMAIGRV